jgi:hypothetical protein
MTTDLPTPTHFGLPFCVCRDKQKNKGQNDHLRELRDMEKKMNEMEDEVKTRKRKSKELQVGEQQRF